MKGIILAGGNGTRLYPSTKVTSKQLLPVYDKPMIYYPLSTLMLMGIKDILVISTPKDTPNIEDLLGDGADIGIKLQYVVQPEPKGIAEAFIIGKDFIEDSDVCLILGDNIFYRTNYLQNPFPTKQGEKAMIFSCEVSDPERFGVIDFDDQMNVKSIEEKPDNPKSKYVSVGLYMYPNDVVAKAESLKPSARNELEITDINNLYLNEGNLAASILDSEDRWFDAGTPESIMSAANFVQNIEKTQGIKIGCIEEIAFRLGYINKNRMDEIISNLKSGDYKQYLQKKANSRPS